MTLAALAALFVQATSTPMPAPVPTPPSLGPADGTPLEVPASLNPSDLDWWWQYGLDGFAAGLFGAVVGGVIAGVATWIAVTKTLDHERALAWEAARRTTDTEVRAAVVAARSRLAMALLQHESDVFELVRLAHVEATTISALAYRTHRELVESLKNFTEVMVERCFRDGTPDRIRIRRHVSELQKRLSFWLRHDPSKGPNLLLTGPWIVEAESDEAPDSIA